MRELLDCMLRNCGTEEHLQTVMTTLLDGSRQVTNICAELAAIAQDTRLPEQAPPGCSVCDEGVDLASGEQQWAGHISRELHGVSVASRCECPRGRWLGEQDRQRKANPDSKRQPRKPALARDRKLDSTGDVA
jgi:hypothetical protein